MALEGSGRDVQPCVGRKQATGVCPLPDLLRRVYWYTCGGGTDRPRAWLKQACWGAKGGSSDVKGPAILAWLSGGDVARNSRVVEMLGSIGKQAVKISPA